MVAGSHAGNRIGVITRYSRTDARKKRIGTAKDNANVHERTMLMYMFFFDMKDGVPLRDLVGIEVMTGAEAIEHSKELCTAFP